VCVCERERERQRPRFGTRCPSLSGARQPGEEGADPEAILRSIVIRITMIIVIRITMITSNHSNHICGRVSRAESHPAARACWFSGPWACWSGLGRNEPMVRSIRPWAFCPGNAHCGTKRLERLVQECKGKVLLCRARRQHLCMFQRFLPDSQGQILDLTVSYSSQKITDSVGDSMKFTTLISNIKVNV